MDVGGQCQLSVSNKQDLFHYKQNISARQFFYLIYLPMLAYIDSQ
jgi:hypothetical protein